MQSNEIQRINELYETFATIPTDQLVLENKKQTVRDIFLNINLFYNRYSILVQDNKILNINKRKDEEIRNKELNNNNNNDYNNSKKQHKNNKTLKKTNNKIMKGNNKHMYKKNKLIHKKHIQSKDRINNNNELKYDNNDNLNKSETQQSKNKDLKINMKQNITSKNNKDNNINSIENNNQNINEKKSHKNKNNENDQSYKKLDNDDSSDYNIEDLDLPKPLSVTEIENMIDNDIRLDIRLNNEQKGILLNEIRFKDINTKHINQITLNEIKKLYLYFNVQKTIHHLQIERKMDLWRIFLEINLIIKNNKNNQNSNDNNNKSNKNNKNDKIHNDSNDNKNKNNNCNKDYNIGKDITNKEIIKNNNNNILNDDEYEDYEEVSEEDTNQQIISTIADKAFVHRVVEQQIGNTCGPHSIVNAFDAVGLFSPTIDMKRIDVDSVWLEEQLLLNNNPTNIKVIESRYLITNRDWWPVLMDVIVAMVLSSIGQIALIVNTTESRVPGAIGHWVVLSIDIYKGHLAPVCIYDSLAKHTHKTEILATTIFDAIANIQLENKEIKSTKTSETIAPKNIEASELNLCYADKVLIEQGLMTIEDFLTPKNVPSEKTANSKIVTSKKSESQQCISITKTKRKHISTQQPNKNTKKHKTKTKIITNVDIVNKDNANITEYYNLYNVVDEEFQKVLNSFSENKDLPNNIPLTKTPNDNLQFITPLNKPSKKNQQKQNTRLRKKNLDTEIKNFNNNIETLTDYDIEIIQKMGKEEITYYPKMFLERNVIFLESTNGSGFFWTTIIV